MNRIAKFEKIHSEQFFKDAEKLLQGLSPTAYKEIYDNIKLPRRATAGSAGYDFYTPFEITLAPGQTVIIPTGIRSIIEDGWFLMCCPRSGLGFKYRIRLDNTVGIIDSDYCYAPNGGHIMIKLTNESLENKTALLECGSAFAQGIFMPFGITYSDDASDKRTGGFGSTSGT